MCIYLTFFPFAKHCLTEWDSVQNSSEFTDNTFATTAPKLLFDLHLFTGNLQTHTCRQKYPVLGPQSSPKLSSYSSQTTSSFWWKWELSLSKDQKNLSPMFCLQKLWDSAKSQALFMENSIQTEGSGVELGTFHSPNTVTDTLVLQCSLARQSSCRDCHGSHRHNRIKAYKKYIC